MKLNHKKSFIGSIVALLIGSSCCWLSSLAAWIGGVTIISGIVAAVSKVQIYFIGIGFLLAIIGIILYFYSRKV